MTTPDETLLPPALEKMRRYKLLAEAQLRCARWEMEERNPAAVASLKAALTAVSTATLALPADGTLTREEHEERLQSLVNLRDTIVSLAAQARHQPSVPAPHPGAGCEAEAMVG
ncbi:hypothetical protein [Streptomyces albospinus]|nr:hypothetical protein [Streptomyces albospinus]